MIKRLSIKKRWISPIYLLVYLIMVLEFQFFLMLPRKGILFQLNSSWNKYLIIFLMFFSLLLLHGYSMKFMSTHKSYFFFLTYTYLIIMLISLFSMVKYNETLIDTFTSWHTYLLLLLVVPLSYICEREHTVSFIENLIIIFSISFCLITMLQGFFFNTLHILFLPGYSIDAITYRNGRIRMMGNSLNIIAFVFLCARAFSNNNGNKSKGRIKYLVGIIIELLTQILFYQTRSSQIIYILILFFVYMISSDNSKIKRIITILLVVLLALQFFDFAGFIDTFSVDTKAGTAVSTTNRLDALVYYANIVKKSPFFGNGFIRDGRNDLKSILNGPYGTYYYSDIGVFGLIAETGICGLSIYVIMMGWIIKNVQMIRRNRNIYSVYEKSVVCGLMLVWVCTSINLAITNPSRAIIMPITFVIINYIVESKRQVTQ